jgi:hypothetical protein
MLANYLDSDVSWHRLLCLPTRQGAAITLHPSPDLQIEHPGRPSLLNQELQFFCFDPKQASSHLTALPASLPTSACAQDLVPHHAAESGCMLENRNLSLNCTWMQLVQLVKLRAAGAKRDDMSREESLSRARLVPVAHPEA